MKRRDFLKSGALGAGATATLAGCGGNPDKLIPLLVPEENILPGEDRWTASTCSICPAGCGALVRAMAGEARVERDGLQARQMVLQVKKMEGNPRHPVNQGRLCARGQAAPQILYNPDRVRTPLALSGPRGSGQYRPLSWDEALALLESKLQPAGDPNAAAGVAAIAGCSSRRRQDLVEEFLAAIGSRRCFREEPPGAPALREANRRIFGRSELEVHDVENARYLLSFGANLVEAHTSPVRYNLGLGHFRQGRPGQRGKFVQVESRFSLTAANSDEWLPARPGTEGAVALAIAHVLLTEELYDKEFVRRSVRGFEEFRALVLERYSPERVAEAADVPAKRITRVAREFARHQPAIALAGGAAVAHPHGVLTAAAAQALNVLAGNIGSRGGISWTASSRKPAAPSPPSTRSWVEDFLAAADSIRVLILWDADPLYGAPAAVGLAPSLARIPFVVACGAFMTDSAAQADLILPDRTFLERWDLSEPAVTTGQRTLSITQPIVKPMYESRDRADVLLGLVRKWGGKVGEALPDTDFESYLKRRLQDENVLGRGSFIAEDLDSFWDTLLEAGVWVDNSAEKPAAAADLTSLARTARSLVAGGEPTDYPFSLQPFASLALGEGQTANLPWMQELPDPMTSVVWGSWVEIHPKRAAELGIEENDLVWLESKAGRIKLPVVFYPAARPDVVSVPFGQGHRLYGRYASGRGANPWDILVPRVVEGAGEAAWAATRVRIAKTGENASVVKLGYDREHSPAELHR